MSRGARMLVLALGVAAPSRFLIALRVVAGTVAIAYLLYFVFELAALLRGEEQHFQRGRPSALMAEALKEEGCNVLEKIDDSEYGKFGWVIDPEGNKVELWQPAQGG